MQKNKTEFLILLLGWLMMLSSAQAASFDCAKASTRVEHLICGNAELSKLDDELAAKYKKVLQNKVTGRAVKRAQRKWLKERNDCVDPLCIRHAYEMRLSMLDSSSLKVQQSTKPPPFSLLKGRGIAVCDAYLKRLNKTKWGYYEKLPTCGRPENDSVEGFAKLNRVPLTAEQVATLYGGVSNFLSSGHSDRGNAKPSDPKPIERAKQSMQRDGLKVWRYDPPVDIDNDGNPDTDVIVWHGGVGQIGPCGRRAGWADSVQISRTLIYSIDWQQMKLNDERTRELFGHPVGGYPITKKGKLVGGFYDGFRPIGLEMGIFSYQGQYYLDAFFDGWGDFEGKRRADWGDGKRRVKNSLMDILGVFLRKDGVTRQICEYRWNEFEKYYQ